MKAAEAGIWQASKMRRLLAEAGLEISAGKMSMLWSKTPTTIRLDDLEVLCTVLECTPCDLLVPTPIAASGVQWPSAVVSSDVGRPASRIPSATPSQRPY
ncbi:helix-turn-helix domain-containing protein [Streptomyces sp. NPDC050658]